MLRAVPDAAAPPPPDRLTALLAGATGLVGGRCLERLLGDAAFGEVVAVARRPLAGERARLRVALCPDFARLEELPPATEAGGGGGKATALCALGTTIKQAGSQAAFRAVDHDAVLAFARWARRSGAETFVVCSAVGASAQSRIFYSRIKGETEEALAGVGFPRLVIVRPSMLLGERAEPRTAEAAVQAVTRGLNPLLLGPLRRYRGVAADTVAAAMVRAAKQAPEGRHVWEHDEIQRAAGDSS
jgi:uncharacterized protein YbjT (DUF2867 family)